MEVNEALESFGIVGRWQFTYYFLVILTFLFPGSWHIFNIIWIGYKPPHRCKIPTNASIEQWIPKDENGKYSSCTMYSNFSISNHTVSCLHGYEYDLERVGPTFSSKWDLVCDRSYLVDTSQTIMSCGVLIGAFIFTGISDHVGRKTTLVVLQTLLNIIGIITALGEHLEWFYFWRFLEGIFQQGVIGINVVQLTEMFSSKHRALISIFGSALWAIAEALLPLIAYVLRNWVHFQIFISAYGFLFFPAFWWLPETVPWLHANDRHEDAENVLLRAAKMNNITLKKPILKPYHDEEDDEGIKDEEKKDGDTMNGNVDPIYTNTDKTNGDGTKINSEGEITEITNLNTSEHVQKAVATKKPLDLNAVNTSTNLCFKNCFRKKRKPKKHLKIQYSVWELFKNRRLLSFLLICLAFGLVDNLVYYGLILSSASLSPNHYMEGFINAIIEIPGCLVIFFSVHKFGRIKPMAASHLFAGLALLGCVLVDLFVAKQYKQVVTSTLSIIGKFWISGAFAIDIFYVTEIFPTNLRNQAFGFCIFFSRLGTLMASYATFLAENYPNVLSIVFGGVSVSVAFLTIFLPETSGRSLPETIEDIEAWYKSDKKKKSKISDSKTNVEMKERGFDGAEKV